MNKTFLSAIVGLCLAASVFASPIGTVIQSDVPLGQAVPLVNQQAKVVTSITLDKGKWVVGGSASLFEQLPATLVGPKTLNASAWISPTVTFNHQGVFIRDSRQFTAFPFTGFIALPMTGKLVEVTSNEDVVLYLVVRSGMQNVGTTPPQAVGFGYIVATRVP